MKISSPEAQQEFNQYRNQEQALTFDSFSRADALSVGLKMLELAKEYADPVAIEITINGLVVFSHFTDGSMADSALWLERKRNSVELMGMSSLRFKYWLDMYGTTLENRKVDPNEYYAGGGGFPILIKNTGMIGSICISGLPSNNDDHQIVVDALTFFKSSRGIARTIADH